MNRSGPRRQEYERRPGRIMNMKLISGILGSLDPTVWILSSSHGDAAGALVATFVSNASIVPDLPRVLVGLARQHATHDLVVGSSVFCLHLIEEPQIEWVWRFGLASGRDEDQLAGVDWRRGATGAPLLEAAPAALECRVETTLNSGDRTIFLAEVVEAHGRSDVTGLRLDDVLARADDEILGRLRASMARDRDIDAAAIRAFRAAMGR